MRTVATDSIPAAATGRQAGTLALCEKDRLLVLDGMMRDATADVIHQADGSIGWLRSGGRIHRRPE
jgi:hypothetical protein